MAHKTRKPAIISAIALSFLAIALTSALAQTGEWREFRHDSGITFADSTTGARMGYNDQNADIVNAADTALHWWTHVPDPYDIWGNANLDPSDWWTLVPQTIQSSPVVGPNTLSASGEAVYFGTEETFLFDPNDPFNNPDNYDYVNIGKVYAYVAEPTTGTDILHPLWEFQVGSDIPEFDVTNPFASRVYSTPVVAYVDATDDQADNPKDYLFVTCGFESDAIPPDGNNDYANRIFTGAVYCLDPTQTEPDPNFPGKVRPLIVWRFEDLETNDDGIEVPHFTGTNYSSPVIWADNPRGYPILFTATADGRIFGINCMTGQRAEGWELDKWKPDETGLETFTLPASVWGSLTLVGDDTQAYLYIGTVGGKFYKIDALDPEQPTDDDEWDAIQWPKNDDDPAIVGPIYSTAAYYDKGTGGKLVFTSWDGHVYCLDEDLNELWDFNAIYKWPPDIPPDQQIDIVPRFDSSPAILPGVTLAAPTMNPDKPAGVYDVVYVASEEGYMYGLDLAESGDIYADHDTYPSDTHELLYKAWIGGGAWSSPAVGFFGVPPTTPQPYVWVGNRASEVRAYRADTFGRLNAAGEDDEATFNYDSSSGQFNSSPALTNELCYIGNQDGILYVFGYGGLLQGMEEPYEESGEVTPSPEVLDPNVYIVSQSDYNNYTYVTGNTGPSEYAWGDTVYVIATGMDGAAISNWNSNSPTRVSFRFTGEGVRTVTQRATIHITSDNKVMARARWQLDPWQTRRQPMLVPGARYYVSCRQQSITETAWDNFGDQTNGQDPTDPADVRQALLMLNLALGNGASIQFLLIENQNAAPEFTILNPLKLYDETGSASGDSIYINGSSGQGLLVDLGDVAHNTESGQVEFAISDISHIGNLSAGKDWINALRARADVMYWFGGDSTVVNPLDQLNSDYIREIMPPYRYQWDLDAVTIQPANFSADYPDLLVDPHKSNLLIEGQNALLANTILRRMDQAGPGTWTEYPTPASVKIRVPKFQPANWGPAQGYPGYEALVTVWVDINGNGQPDIPSDGDAHSTGRYEAYRQFIVGLSVPVDRRLDFQTSELDIGSEPHGYQSWLAARSPNQLIFAKDYVLQNNGNVNMYDVQLLLRPPQQYPILDWLSDSFFCDGVDWRAFIPVTDPGDSSRKYILSTINGDDPSQPPDTTYGGINSYSLHKPRVGDTRGADMTVPDVRPGEDGFANELLPQVTVKAPLGIPFGTYASHVYAVDKGGEWVGGTPVNSNFAVSLSPMEVVVSARENKLTGPPFGVGDPTLWDDRYQVDVESSDTGAIDATAAAYRVPSGPFQDDMRLIFSSNRVGGGSPTATDSYFLYTTTLTWDDSVGNWVIPGGNEAWWNGVTGFPDQGTAEAMFSELGGNPDAIYSFSAPAVDTLEDASLTYLAFKGDAFVGDANQTEVARLSKVFLAQLQANGVPNLSDAACYVVPDTKLGKDTPRPLVYTDPVANDARFVLFWSQESAGKWDIYYTAHEGLFSGDEAEWQVPKRLELPRGMMSGRDPMPIFRPLLAEGSAWDHPVWVSHVDVFYSGIERHKGDPDIYWSRYKVVETTSPAWSLTLEPVPFPASVMEPMERIQKSGEAVFVSFGVDWDMDFGSDGDPDYQTTVVFFRNGDPNQRWYLVGGGTNNHGYNRLARDTATGAYVFKQGAYTTILDPGAGLVRITTSDPVNSPLPMDNEPVYISYQPRGYRVTRDDAADSHPVAFIDQILDDPDAYHDMSHLYAPTRLWVLWRRSSVESPGGAMYYKTYRLGVDTGRDLYLDPNLVDDYTGVHLPYHWDNDLTTGRRGPVWFIDWSRGRHYFPLFDEGNEHLNVRAYEGAPGGPVTFTDFPGAPRWIEERGDTLAQMEVATNQANLAAFLDPVRIPRAWDTDPDTNQPRGWFWLPSVTRVWLFWTGSADARTDLYYESLVPRFEIGNAPELYAQPPRYH